MKPIALALGDGDGDGDGDQRRDHAPGQARHQLRRQANATHEECKALARSKLKEAADGVVSSVVKR